ncbi:CgeB family protein [Paenibacillus dendritiformis]|uniref:CgeB family protein n=1 Tax=Paenibacillus dendritiformis TaxID=130049 RepID=UPI0020C42071|nr:glycosyltransferase [Paenibacillus dendritiformis]CAH8767332.1 glycosyltransferase [Paenibacillus dendritiformis]
MLKEERSLRSKLDIRNIKYNKNEWAPSTSEVILNDHEIVIEGNETTHCYLSYLEKNNSFDIKPSTSIFPKLNLYNRLFVDFKGEVLGECDIKLFIITYSQGQKAETHWLDINNHGEIDINNVDDMRISLRIQGNGTILLDSITLKPLFDFFYNNTKNGENTTPRRKTRQLKVAMVVDEFTYESFKYECEAIYLSPNNWLETLQETEPDFFFCESAWSGKDPDTREWKGKVYSSINFKKENRTELLNIIRYCNENQITTVFWNKEDPTHFDDKVHNFVDTALKFDYIFTTSEECVVRYKEEYGHKKVYPLMFAVQPKHFNPIESYERTDDIVFSGSYYKQHPIRCEEMERIFDLIIQQDEQNLIVYNRQSENQDENHIFPERFKPYLRPRVPYTRLDKAYKGSKYAININTEVNSKTMFARRVFELIASNTLVISNYSKGLEWHFGELLFLLDVNNQEESKRVISKLKETNYHQHRLKALRYVLKNHTYEKRMEYILDIIGVNSERKESEVCMVIFSKNGNEIEGAISLFENQNFPNKKLLIVLTEENSIETARYVVNYASENIFLLDLHYFNKYNRSLEDVIDADYVSFMDTEFDYGSNYLSDMILNYTYLSNETVVTKKLECKPYTFVNEGLLHASIFPRSALKYYEFNINGEFIKRLFQCGYTVFNCDEFNVLYPEGKREINPVSINI